LLPQIIELLSGEMIASKFEGSHFSQAAHRACTSCPLTPAHPGTWRTMAESFASILSTPPESSVAHRRRKYLQSQRQSGGDQAEAACHQNPQKLLLTANGRIRGPRDAGPQCGGFAQTAERTVYRKRSYSIVESATLLVSTELLVRLSRSICRTTLSQGPRAWPTSTCRRGNHMRSSRARCVQGVSEEARKGKETLAETLGSFRGAK
jgi:hypothetical protein